MARRRGNLPPVLARAVGVDVRTRVEAELRPVAPHVVGHRSRFALRSYVDHVTARAGERHPVRHATAEPIRVLRQGRRTPRSVGHRLVALPRLPGRLRIDVLYEVRRHRARCKAENPVWGGDPRQASAPASRSRWRRCVRSSSRKRRTTRNMTGGGTRRAKEYVDVLIVGSGPAGWAYARAISDTRPQTTILVVEVSPKLSDAIGEHTSNMTEAERLASDRTSPRRRCGTPHSSTSPRSGADPPRQWTSIHLARVVHGRRARAARR